MEAPSESRQPHFRIGFRGWWARFLIARHASGDPLDETVVLPSVTFLVCARLNSLGRIDAFTVIVALTLSAILSGLWIGLCRGSRGLFRAMLRSILVGAIEGAGSVAVVSEPISQQHALWDTFNLIYVNYFFFFFAALFGGIISDVGVISERDWQRGAARRAYVARYSTPVARYFMRVLRLTFAAENVARVALPALTGLVGFVISLILSKYYLGISINTTILSRLSTK